MKTTLIIMAGGMGTRFKGGVKVLEPIGPSGEFIMEYSVYDAIRAGFDKIILVLKKDIADFEKIVKNIINNKIEKIQKKLNTSVEIEFVYQDLNYIPEGFKLNPKRTKPWGTGQAVLMCKDLVNEPFAVINSDDFYGYSSFKILHDYLKEMNKESEEIGLVGFNIMNTLPERGPVTRGLCAFRDDYLTNLLETRNIQRAKSDAVCDLFMISGNSIVSMNMWAFNPNFMKTLESGYIDFFYDLKNLNNVLYNEYLIPEFIHNLLLRDKIKVKLLESSEKTFGLTSAEDVREVKEKITEKIKNGEYPDSLY